MQLHDPQALPPSSPPTTMAHRQMVGRTDSSHHLEGKQLHIPNQTHGQRHVSELSISNSNQLCLASCTGTSCFYAGKGRFIDGYLQCSILSLHGHLPAVKKAEQKQRAKSHNVMNGVVRCWRPIPETKVCQTGISTSIVPDWPEPEAKGAQTASPSSLLLCTWPCMLSQVPPSPIVTPARQLAAGTARP